MLIPFVWAGILDYKGTILFKGCAFSFIIIYGNENI